MDKERQLLINRLKRIEGQVRGIGKMISEEQDCAEILMQIAAVKAAVNKVGTLVFQTHFRSCLETAITEGETDFVDEVMQMLSKYI
ncbi:MAG TPA: metal-sensitive transcriptional regulator, partial [Oscillospiraceae bacterium]|nr:metal-sensitive transcriptional regulator [Oscillospiraceae bacterium]